LKSEESTEKLRRDSTFVCRDSARQCRSRETFQGFKEEKLKRKSAFEHRATAARSAEFIV
jgi:hypothetical protein